MIDRRKEILFELLTKVEDPMSEADATAAIERLSDWDLENMKYQESALHLAESILRAPK